MLAILASCDSYPALRLVVVTLLIMPTICLVWTAESQLAPSTTCVLFLAVVHVTAICHHVECSCVVQDLAVSSGSACTSASLEPSYVLRALGVEEDMAHTSLRLDSQDPIPLVLLLAALCICVFVLFSNQSDKSQHCSANGHLRIAQQVCTSLMLYWHTSSFAICSIDRSVLPFVSAQHVLTLCAMQVWPGQIHNSCRS